MKKELLLATTIAGMTLGATSAGAVTASTAGHSKVGIHDVDKDSNTASTGTMDQDQQASFSVSMEETLDSGTKISAAFDIADENSNAIDPGGLTLTFTDGSSLDIIEAGHAAYSYEAAVPGASGEQGISAATSNAAKRGIDGVSGNNAVGFEWASGADAMGVDGLSFGFSMSSGDESNTTSSANADSSTSGGVSYATTTGDTTVTIGAGFVEGSDNNSNSAVELSVWNLGAVAVNGDFTVGAGVGQGEFSSDQGDIDAADAAMADVEEWEAMEAGISYVSGDLTFTASYSTATAKDHQAGTTIASTEKEDESEATSMSLDYAVATGVTTTIGYTSVENSHEGTKQTASSGSSWYIGTKLSF